MLKVIRHGLMSLFNKKVISITIIFVLVSWLIFIRGIGKHKHHIYQGKEFVFLENKKSDKFINSINEGQRGRLILFLKAVPSTLFALFQCSTPFDDMRCIIDNSGTLLDLNSKIGKKKFGTHSVLRLDFASYNYVIASLLILILGHSIYQDRKRLKFLMNDNSFMCVFSGLLLSRVLYIIFTFLVSFGVVLITFFFSKTTLTNFEITCILSYFVYTITLMTLFLILSSFAGVIKNAVLKILFIFFIWPGLSIIIPGEFNEMISSKSMSNSISAYNQELKKFLIWTDYEKLFFEKYQSAKTANDRKTIYKEMNDRYIERELVRIKKLELELIDEARELTKKIYRWNLLIPTSYYSAICCELSSFGYYSFIDFHKDADDKQKNLVKSYFRGETLKVFDFTHRAKSRYPNGFKLSLLINLLWIVILTIALYFKVKRFLFIDLSSKDFKEVKIHVQRGDYVFAKVSLGIVEFADKIFNVCFAGHQFEGDIKVGNKSIDSLRVFYIPELNDFNIKNKSFSDLTFKELLVYFPRLKEVDLIILENVKLQPEQIKGVTILELNTETVYRQNNIYYYISLDNKGNKFVSELKHIKNNREVE